MELEREQAGVARELRVVIVEHGDARAVEPNLGVRSVGDDAVGVPRGRGAEERFVVVGLAEFFRPAAAVGRDGEARAPDGERAAPFFVMDVAEVALAEIDVGLVALGMSIGQALAAIEDAGVGIRRTAEAEFGGQLEIGNLALPVEKLVIRECGAGGDFTGDRAVLDAPERGVAIPASECAAIEEWLRCGRGRVGNQTEGERRDGETRRRQERSEFHGAKGNRCGRGAGGWGSGAAESGALTRPVQ